jgi:hypothetical protein
LTTAAFGALMALEPASAMVAASSAYVRLGAPSGFVGRGWSKGLLSFDGRRNVI